MAKPLLFIPGPVTVAEPVLAAMAQPMIDHRGPEFRELIDSVAVRMKPIFGTIEGDVVLLGSSGTGGLEAAVGSLFGSGDVLLACPIGVFGERIIAIARSMGCEVEVLPTDWGAAVDPAALRARLAADTQHRIRGILLTHNETSTGTQNDMAALAAAIRPHPALVVVDSVSGLGASRFAMDEWDYDVVVTASQKALAVPPGLAMVAVRSRAWAAMAERPAHNYYFDLRKAREFAALGQTPWTPPVSLVFALDVALERYVELGAENAWAWHDRYARAIRAAATALGLELFSLAGAHSQTVVAIKAPDGLDVDAIRRELREERGVVLGGGQKNLKGKILRIGTMGDLTQTDILGMIGALEIALLNAGRPIRAGSGVQAALRIFLDHGAAVTAGA